MSRNSIGGEDFSQKESMEIPGLRPTIQARGPQALFSSDL